MLQNSLSRTTIVSPGCTTAPQVDVNGNFLAVHLANDLDPSASNRARSCRLPAPECAVPSSHYEGVFPRCPDLTQYEHRVRTRDEDCVARPKRDILRERPGLQAPQIDPDRLGIRGVSSLCGVCWRLIRPCASGR